MKNYFQLFQNKFEAIYMAVAFAESGEWDTAREIMGTAQKPNRQNMEKKSQPRLKRQTGMRVY